MPAPKVLAEVEGLPAEYRIKAAKETVLMLPLVGWRLITYKHVHEPDILGCTQLSGLVTMPPSPIENRQA